ncbi:universal stress protein [Natrinema sp. SYSU A 869]|uniref:universal stress protein n=1 Tax=Natrinema sp. SYSU A 869 TaxID=2871694 RepID=UPI002105F192|nr:universal stress protein [Natrinema sp. SYSU A 869]
MGSPHHEIGEYAVDHSVDHVVMGSHSESSVTSPFLGRVSHAVLRRIPVSTTVVPGSLSEVREHKLPGQILVPVDGSEQSIDALRYASDQFPDGRITIFHAVTLPFEYRPAAFQGTALEQIVETQTERGNAVLDSALEAVGYDNTEVGTRLVYETPSRSIA